MQILDLANVKIESEEDFKAVIEKIPDYRIKPERVSESARVQGDPVPCSKPPVDIDVKVAF